MVVTDITVVGDAGSGFGDVGSGLWTNRDGRVGGCSVFFIRFVLFFQLVFLPCLMVWTRYSSAFLPVVHLA